MQQIEDPAEAEEEAEERLARQMLCFQVQRRRQVCPGEGTATAELSPVQSSQHGPSWCGCDAPPPLQHHADRSYAPGTTPGSGG